MRFSICGPFCSGGGQGEKDWLDSSCFLFDLCSLISASPFCSGDCTWLQTLLFGNCKYWQSRACTGNATNCSSTRCSRYSCIRLSRLTSSRRKSSGRARECRCTVRILDVCMWCRLYMCIRKLLNILMWYSWKHGYREKN